MNAHALNHGSTQYAILMGRKDQMTKFVWFTDEKIYVENGKQVLTQGWDANEKKWKCITWLTRKDARMLWTKLIEVRGFVWIWENPRIKLTEQEKNAFGIE
jgi:hypothetical protein